MICKKCGCIIEPEAKECSFCGERAEAGQEDLMTRFVGDDGAREIIAAMPRLVALRQLEDVPQEKDRMLSELNRLQGYFAHIRGKYATLGDLWLMQTQNAEPVLANYTIGGGIATLFFFLILTGFFPSVPWTFFFAVWLGVTSISYVQAGKAHERRAAQLEADIRGLENEVREFYNRADGCFLPLDYSDPQIIQELITGVQNGAITSFREVKLQGCAIMEQVNSKRSPRGIFMSLFALCLLLVCPVLFLLVAFRFFRQHNYKMTALFVCLAVTVGFIGGVKGYGEMDTRTKSTTASTFDRDQKENMTRRYEQAVSILKGLNFNHPDREKAEEAVHLLQDFHDAQLLNSLDGACPDAEMLLSYAEAMNQVAAYRGHMSNKDVAGDRKLLSIVQDMPESYKGTLAEKIVPFRRLIIAMNEAAEKEAELDKKNAQKHAANLSKGKYGGIHPGDSEDNITAAYGEPSRVNVSEGEGKKMKQYVFNHNGKSIYVYTQDGIVTDVSM